MPLPDDDALTKRMKKLRLREEDLEEDFIRGSGIWGTRDEVTKKIEALIDAGCTYFMFDSRGLPEPGELEALIEVTKQFA